MCSEAPLHHEYGSSLIVSLNLMVVETAHSLWEYQMLLKGPE